MNTDNGSTDRDVARSAPLNAERAQQITEEVARSSRIPGISVAVADPAGVLWAGAAGFADLQSRRRSTTGDQYLWFSMTKIATASTAMRLHAADVLDLDAPIGSYLAGYRPHPRNGHPTTRQLLTHTAGLGNPLPLRWVRPEGEPEDPKLFDRVIARHGTPKAADGRAGVVLQHRLSAGRQGDRGRHGSSGPAGRPGVRAGAARHVGHRLRLPGGGPTLGGIRVGTAPRRTPPARSAARRTGRRAGGGNTALRPFLVSGAAYGGLIGTVTDAVRLAASHAADTSGPHPLLAQADIDAMRTITATGKPFDHGIGWFRKPADAERSPGFVEHYGTGAGYWNAMRIYPELRLAMVAMTNTTSRWDVDGLFTRLAGLSWS